MEGTHGFLEVDGGRLYFEAAGEGPPAVLIHAGLWDARIWDDQFVAFAERHTVLRYHMRGFGRSSRFDRPFSERRDLSALMDFLDLPQAALVGASVGGALAVDFAIEFPSRVTALVLSASGLGGDDSADDERMEAIFAQVKEAADGGDLERAVDLELEIWAPLRTDPEVDERIHRIAQENRHELTLDWKLDRLLDPPAAGRLGEIGAPTLVLIGEEDAPVMSVIAGKLVAGISGARKEVVAGADHLPNMRRPGEFNRIVLGFLAEVGP